MYKKYFTTFLMVTMLLVMVPLASTTAIGQTRSYNSRTRTSTTYKKPNFYRRHRKAINIAGGAGVGALVGGLLGGKKWALIGGLAGAGGGAFFTHKQKPKNYVRRYRSFRNY